MNRIFNAITLAGITLTAPSAVLAQSTDYTLNPTQIAVEQAAVPAGDLELAVWMDRADGVYHPGETARIFVRTNRDAHIQIFNTNAAGEAMQILPNEWETDTRVPASTSRQIPADEMGQTYALNVGEPYGVDVLKIVASTSPEVFSDLTVSGAGFKQVAGGGLALVDSMRTLTPTPMATAEPAAEWAQQSIRWTVAPRTQPPVQQAPTDAPAAPAEPTEPAPVAEAEAEAEAEAGPAPHPAIEMIVADRSAFGLTVATSKARYRVGERLSIQVTPERRCELVLLDVNEDGYYTVLYPNQVEEATWMKKEKVNFIADSQGPLEIRATAPGTHTLYAMCSANRTLGQAIFGAPIERSMAAPKQMSLEEILELQPRGDVARAFVTYTVTP